MKEQGLNKKALGLLAVLVFILFLAAVGWFIGRPMIKLVGEPEQFRDWVDGHGIWGRLIFIGMMVLQVICALIPGEPFEIGAGYAFGAIEGTALCLIGIALGCLVVFLFVRRYGVRLVEVFFSREKIDSVRFLQNTRRLELLIFIVNAIPGTPKDLLSYFVALTKIKLSTWLLIVVVSRIPSVVTSTVGGSALGMENYVFAIVTFAVTLVVSGIGVLIYNRIRRGREE